MALQWFHNFASLVELTSEVSWKTTGSLEELEINFLEASICQLALFLFTICLEPGNLHEQLLLTLTKRGSRSRFSLVFLPKMSFFHILLLFSTYNAPAIYKDFKTILRKRNYANGIHRNSPLVLEAFRGLRSKKGEKTCLGMVVKNLMKIWKHCK